MAARYASESDGDDDFHSLSMHPSDHGSDDTDADIDEDNDPAMAPPVHPIPSFQGAFEESIVESTDHQISIPSLGTDAEMRRRRLLEAHRYEDVRKTRWKQKPDAKHHPFLKLMAQIVFGMHLLQQEQAKSNEEVVRILQNHVNEVDSFLERTSEDFDLAIKDTEERIRYLKLPMQHMEVFAVMLDEKKFRNDLLNGNEKIEKIIGRTAKAMNDAVFDIASGIESTKELGVYLTNVEKTWPSNNIEIADVFGAMRGNEQGWLKYLNDLLTKSKNLNNDLVTLGNVIGEINRLAGAASRRNKPQSRNDSPATEKSGGCSPGVGSKFAKDSVAYRKPGPWLDKPLPQEPDTNGGAVNVAMSKPHPVPFDTRYEQPRRTAPVPRSRSSSNTNRSPPRSRPRTAVQNAGPRNPRGSSKDNIKELPDFFRHSGPLRSNPPDVVSTKKPGRSQSQSASEMMKVTAPRSSQQVRRSRSQGNIALAKQPSKSIPRKPVGSGSPGTQIKLVPQAGTPKVEVPSITNGFSRRLSRKLRNLPAPIKNTPNTEPISRPIDSAYSSTPEKDRKRSTSSPTDFTTDTDKELPLEPEKDDAAAGHGTPPGSRLGLFPKDTGPLTPSQASFRSKDNSPNSKGWETSTDNSPKTHSSKASRTMSIRRFFSHRKAESHSVVV
ncbi:hypothetical protein PRZ48_011620 [Zasmidium cellare]|uniref:Uncharacterized protein n=1 Tax=Zasmidium cellare TaxID=395010 RepID=A0ABR0E7E2_ZASCE|nr:hypothetical protein PRZ48_011620 [Zasmidium cellare]